MTEASSVALQAVIGEFKNISPELSRAYVFKKDGEVLASNEAAIAEERAKRIATAFDELAEQSEVIGRMETLCIQGVSNQLNIAAANSRYVVTVSSRVADEKMVKALTYVIIPAIIKLLDQVDPSASTNEPADTAKPDLKKVEENIQPLEEPTPTALFGADSTDIVFPFPPVNQFMVEKIGGLLVASDIVRVDVDVAAKWRDLYGDKEITQVEVETLEGKAVRCRFKPIKEAEGNSRGVIQIPEKILQALRTSEGKLVMVKPVIPTEKEEKR